MTLDPAVLSNFFDGSSEWLVEVPNRHGAKHHPTRRECRHGIPPDDLPHLVVVHTAESLPDYTAPDLGAERVARYASDTHRNVSWHATVDSDSAIRMLPDDHTAWHVRGYNRCSVGVEIATQAHRWSTAPPEWVEAVLDRTAQVVASWCKEHSLEARRLDSGSTSGRGIVAHRDLDPMRRSDPGDRFPWTRFLELVKRHRDDKRSLDPAPVDEFWTRTGEGLIDDGASPNTLRYMRRHYVALARGLNVDPTEPEAVAEALLDRIKEAS